MVPTWNPLLKKGAYVNESNTQGRTKTYRWKTDLRLSLMTKVKS